MVIRGHRGLEEVTWGYKRLRGVAEVTGGYSRLQEITWVGL